MALAPSLTCQRLRQPLVDVLGDRGAQQEALDVRGLGGHHLAHEVVGDGLVVAGEARWFTTQVATTEVQRRQPHSGRPALGALEEQLDAVRVHGYVVGGQHGGRFRTIEGQVHRTDLRELVSHPQSVQGQRGVGPREDDQSQLTGWTGEQRGHPGEHRWFVHEVEVVEHHHDWRGQPVEAGGESFEVAGLAAQARVEPGQRVVQGHVDRTTDGGDE